MIVIEVSPQQLFLVQLYRANVLSQGCMIGRTCQHVNTGNLKGAHLQITNTTNAI